MPRGDEALRGAAGLHDGPGAVVLGERGAVHRRLRAGRVPLALGGPRRLVPSPRTIEFPLLPLPLLEVRSLFCFRQSNRITLTLREILRPTRGITAFSADTNSNLGESHEDSSQHLALCNNVQHIWHIDSRKSVRMLQKTTMYDSFAV